MDVSVYQKKFEREKSKVAELERILEDLSREAFLRAEEAQAANFAKSEFLSNMSHELRTPMHAILNFCEIGRMKIESENFSGALSALDRIDLSAKRLLNLINALLDLSKLESGKIELQRGRVDLVKLVSSVVSELESLLIEKGIRLHFDTEHGEVLGSCDQELLRQVFNNLIANAIRFSPESGEIAIEISQEEREGISWVCCSCRDEGKGIPQEEAKAVFDKFEQGKKTKSGLGGTGLGLAICREIIELHSGRIWVDTTVGKGCRVAFEFPDQSMEVQG